MDDVFKAVDELEFSEFGEPLKEALAGETRGKTPAGVPTAPDLPPAFPSRLTPV